MTMDIASQVYISLEAIIGVLAIIGNALVLIAILKFPKLQNVTNFFIASLAIADLLVGIFVAPLAALSYLGLPEDYLGCVFTNSIVVVLTQTSIFNLVDIAIERFIAIKNPFFYQEHMTKRVAVIMITISWVLALIIGLVPVFGWNLGPMKDNKCAFVAVIDFNYMVYFNFFGFVLTPLIIMFVIYTYIFYIVRQQMAKISALEVMQKPDTRKLKSRFKREVKAAKSLAVVFGVFALCWIPIHILNSISHLCKTCSYPINLLLAAILLSHINSIVNPFLYAIGNSQFQVAFKRMFCGYSSAGFLDDEFTTVSRAKCKGQKRSVDKASPVHMPNDKYVNKGFTGSNSNIQQSSQNAQVFHIAT
ncbi:adenosine receptor A2b-like [Saccostrea cucullata]|uniref:adenosine receptor A2b-like n=1 Tax=Saccostrea cuccullata TaxID=36930 RepID=UPI002ED1551D